jgi:hypothetical protein
VRTRSYYSRNKFVCHLKQTNKVSELKIKTSHCYILNKFVYHLEQNKCCVRQIKTRVIRASPIIPHLMLIFFFFGKSRQNLLQEFLILDCHLSQVGKRSLRTQIYVRADPWHILRIKRGGRAYKIILFLSQGS